MDEAQHLADRVAILREGGIVAEGPPGELGESLGRRTVIGFALTNGGLSVEDVARAARRAQLEVVRQRGRASRPSSRRPTSTACSRWPRSAGRELEDLEVRRPSLEDVFLELTGEEDGA